MSTESETPNESNETPSTNPTPEVEGAKNEAGASDAESTAPSTEATPAPETAEAATAEDSSSEPQEPQEPEAATQAEAPTSEAAVVEAVASTTPAVSSSRSTTDAAKSAAPSAGQRIAAQKAAKAAKKAVDKAKRAEDAANAASENEGEGELRPVASSVPDEVELRAAEVSRYVESHSDTFFRAIGALVAAAVIAFGVSFYFDKKEESAGWALAHAVAATSASIGAAPEEPDGKLRFGTEAMRDAEGLRRFRKVVTDHPSSDAARFARVAIASFLIGQSKYADAQAELRKAREGLEGDVRLDAAILEANGLALLGQEKYAEAQTEFERLGRVDRPRNQNASDYLLARTAFQRGDRNGAKERLRAILDRLDDEGAAPAPYVEEQSRELLRQIDPAAVPAPAGGGLSGLDSLPPEILQQLLRAQGLGQ